ncbi:patatin-like phospholipase family protein [Corticibacter populi]|uniref:Patatin-like phospholipase family protein n=1 Tax=Corticibacter populi TaxID=1550736 RepID=A0A3M6QY26_9BURK|nr:patatin-like phospholipase family protein [Corticibacter populi]RMX07925.1 patatin-like phospholipase family protein [Corticibacter populi]RZS35164.1 NTE family protein [Corticibacter populi]
MPPARPPHPAEHAAHTALVCAGGGARAAYQVGVLKALCALRRQYLRHSRPSPFGILSGTSAGALNIAALASRADHFEQAVARLEQTWRQLHVEQVYRADSWSVIRTGARWLRLLSTGWALARWSRGQPRALLDNTPLHALLQTHISMKRIPRLIARGHLRSVAISASSYTSGRHTTFYESATPLQPWVRSQRQALHARLTHAHLLASASLPFIFPAQAVCMPGGHTEYFGDGAMRQTAPMAPAIHLGAERILVIGVGRSQQIHPALPYGEDAQAPSLAHIAGHALTSIFLDTLSTDIERLERINHTLSLIDPALRQQHSGLRPIDLLVLTPTQNIDHIAAKHLAQLPPSIQALLGALGTGQDARQLGHTALASYLLFEPGFIDALIALGHADAMAKQQALARFMGWV